MMIGFELEGGLIESFEAMTERAEDLGPPCRAWGAYKRKEVKARIEAVSLPLAESTLQKRRQTGTSTVTKHGEIRASAARRLDARGKRIDGLLAFYRKKYLVHTPWDVQQKIDRLQKQRAAINRALVRSQETGYAERRIGKTLAERKGEKRFPKLASTIRMQVVAKGGAAHVVVRSTAGVIGKVQNDGGAVGNGASVPATNFMSLTSTDVEVFKRLLIEHGIGVLTEGA